MPCKKKSCIPETKNLSTNPDRSTNTKKILLVRQNLTKKNTFFERRFYTLWAETTSYLYFSPRIPKIGVKKKTKKHFTPFMSKSFHIWDYFFQLLFPKDFEYLKSLDIALREMEAKRHLNRVNFLLWRTDKQTNVHMNISTYRKNWPRRPILWKSLATLYVLGYCWSPRGSCLPVLPVPPWPTQRQQVSVNSLNVWPFQIYFLS